MKRVGIVLHWTRATATEVGRILVKELTARGITVACLADDAERLGAGVAVVSQDGFTEGLDLVFVLGGDGTLLRAASLVAGHDTPLLGVNLGRLGFLTQLEREDLPSALDAITTHGFHVSDRMSLQGEVLIDGESTEKIWALNDVIIEKLSPGRLINLAVSIDGEPFTTFAADGLIVASPTGSTAYSFSAHGPVVSPQLDCLILTPVSAHMLFDRSIVVSPQEEISITVMPDPDAVSLSLDGRKGMELVAGAEVRVRAGDKRVRLASVSSPAFWTLVRNKFGLRGAER